MYDYHLFDWWYQKFQISNFKFQIKCLAEIKPFEPGQVMLPREEVRNL